MDNNTNCVICKKEFKGKGNNPQPLSQTGECCNTCNYKLVIPARMKEHSQHGELIPTSCSECDKEVRAMGDSMVSEEDRKWQENPFAKEWKAKNDEKKRLEISDEDERQLTEDKRREEAEQCQRDDNAEVENIYNNFDNE